MSDRTVSADDSSLPPWKAFLGLVLCVGMAVWFYRVHYWWPACAVSAIAGMFLQDWSYRLSDKYDPNSIMGDDLND